MGKNIYTRHLNDENGGGDGLGPVFPRCIWGFGFMHNIDYHHWRSSLKRMLLQKINPRKRSKGKTRAKELDHDAMELQKLLNEDEKHFPSAKDSGVKQKKSLKARIKSLIAEEISKEWNGKQRGSSVSSQPKMRRTYSIHHLEPPDHGLPELCTDWESPILFFPNNKDSGAAKLWDLKKMNITDKPDTRGKKSEEKNKNASRDKERTNVLEVFKANKHLFLENLQDANDGRRKFSHTLPGSRTNARLTKSGSYPAPRLAQKRDLEPSSLKQKQSEIWPAPKGEKLNNGTAIPKVERFKSSMHSRSNSLPSEYSIRGRKFGEALNFFLETSAESDTRNTESNLSAQSEETKGGDEVSNGYNSSAVENYSDKRTGESATEEQFLGRSTQSHRRSSSLNESVDKYSRLFGNDLGKEVNLGSSRSLRLRSEYEMGLGGNGPIIFGRIRSLSHVEIYYSIQNEVQDDANLEDRAITAVGEGSSSTADSCQDELKNAGPCPSTKEAVLTGDIQESKENVDKLEQMMNLAAPEETNTIDTECVAGVDDQVM